MKQKQIIEIKSFDNFSDNSKDIVVKKFYNYQPSFRLKNSKGIDVALFPKNPTNLTMKELNIANIGITSIEGLAYFKQYFRKNNFTTHRLVVYGDDKKVYINQMLDDTYSLSWLYDLTFDSKPVIFTYKKDDSDAAILASDEKMVVWKTNYSPYKIEGVPKITSMCMNDGVLFCTIVDPAFKIWYATDLDIENIGNISNYSGYISLEDELGDARKILTFNEEVFVFRDYGISKISLIKKEKIVTQIYASNTRIYANTVSVCGNNILFMTKDGLYSFNGFKVSKTKMNLLSDLSIKIDNAVASCLGEKYYVALKIDFDDESQILFEEGSINNAIIIFDTCDFKFEIIRGVDVKDFLPLKTEVFEKMLTVFNTGPTNKIGEVVERPVCFDQPLPKCWESGKIIDNLNTKLFTKLMVDADKDVKIILKYDNKQQIFNTYKKGINEFLFKICCKDIKLEIISSNETAEVEKLVMKYYEN